MSQFFRNFPAIFPQFSAISPQFSRNFSQLVLTPPARIPPPPPVWEPAMSSSAPARPVGSRTISQALPLRRRKRPPLPSPMHPRRMQHLPNQQQQLLLPPLPPHALPTYVKCTLRVCGSALQTERVCGSLGMGCGSLNAGQWLSRGLRGAGGCTLKKGAIIDIAEKFVCH